MRSYVLSTLLAALHCTRPCEAAAEAVALTASTMSCLCTTAHQALNQYENASYRVCIFMSIHTFKLNTHTSTLCLWWRHRGRLHAM